MAIMHSRSPCGENSQCHAVQKPSAKANVVDVTNYKTNSLKLGDRGQTKLLPAAAHFQEQFSRQNAGACESIGYTVADGDSDFKVSVLGKLS